jgi:hypothetical protein
VPSRFGFNDMGIADLLREGTLTTPPNQRSYAWQERHVKNFLEDIGYAIDRPRGRLLSWDACPNPT